VPLARHRFCSRAGPNRSTGFTLTEVLVSVLVLALGLLGLAGLQTSSLRSTQSAMQRSETSYLAYEIADRMRANQTGVAAGNYNNQSGTNDDCLANVCTPAQLAGYDLTKWANDLRSRLPSGTGVICIDSTPDDGDPPPSNPMCDGQGNAYAIKIWWDDDRTGNSTQFRRFVTSIRP
jgi:type IV pilus assembly protein PilV